MLYKKNKDKALRDEVFKNPTCEYRGTPFWSWNCKMTPEILEKQIEYLKEMGYGGFHMHSRAGMDNPYLSDEFMGLVKACVNKAKREDMLAWLYDEDRWPSGAAGGLVTKTPEYRSRYLCFMPASMLKTGIPDTQVGSKAYTPPFNEADVLPMNKAIEKGAPYFVAAYDIILDENGCLKSYRQIKKNSKAKGTKWVCYCLTQGKSGWYNGETYVDTLSPKAVKKFIEITHETYKKAVGKEFDKTVPAIFTDEPQFTRGTNLNYPTDLGICTLPWTHDLPKTYKKAYESDIIEHIPELVWNLPNSEVSVDRYRYHDHVCERFTAAFSELCGKWCDKNGIQLTGHMMEEPTLHSQTHMIGEAMRAYKYFGYPGIDMLAERMEYTTAKQTQSVVHQYGKEAMMSELYGVTNWDFDFRGHKFHGDWQAALGVTIRVPHLSWVSMKGDAKRDYPATLNYQSPWYKEYPYIEDHFARLNTALTRGKPHVNIGVLHPIESYWLHWGPGKTTLAVREEMDRKFLDFIQWMIFAQLDFDYISESLFPEECKKADAPISVGKMKYSTLIVPGMETMRSTTLKRLKDFKAAGGNLIFVGDCPTHVDAVKSDAVRELYEQSEHIPFNRLDIINALENERELEIRGTDGALTSNYIYQMRDDGNAKWLFVCNAKKYGLADAVKANKIFIKIKGELEPKLYDTITGEIKDITYRCEKGWTYIERVAYLHDSFLFKLTKAKKKSASVEEKKFKVISSVDFRRKVDYTLDEPNVVVLDLAEYKWDDEKEFQPLEEMLRLDRIVRRKAQIPAKTGCQPWAIPKEIPTHTVTVRFTFDSEITVSDAMLATEDADVSTVLFDDKQISNKTVGYFTDESIQKIPLPVIIPGRHTITITRPLGSRTYNEWSYLLGTFNVRLEGVEKTLIAPTKQIGFGSITSQGLPFYGGNIRYKVEIDIPDDGCGLKIHANNYRGSLISVDIDGKRAGRIVFAPYDLIIENVAKGKHVIEFTLYGNRFNSFAALHDALLDRDYVSPNAWFTGGDEWCYEYTTRPLGIMASPIISVIK